MKPKSNHQLRCSVCHRLFGRIDHLKRHQLHHTGVKPYCCQFCNEEFTRSDNLRKHYQNCARRGEASIPAIARKGRKRHACDPCIAAKLRCDGDIPCSSCVRKHLECSTRISENSLSGDVSISLGKELSLKTDTEKRVTDFLHIKFLLDGGTDSFTESFHLPPRSDRIRGFFYHIQREWESGAGFVDLQSEQDPSTNTELAITGSGFDYFNLFLQNGDSSFCSTEMSSIDLPGAKQGPFVKEMIQESTISSKMIVSIIDQVSRLDLDTSARQTVLNDLHFLLTPARVRNFISLYFRHWHQNYQMIHLPSFSMDTAPVPLLTAMAFMGALYSCNETESTVARRLLDFAESFVFSTKTFTYQHTVGRDLFTSTVTSDPWHDPWHFENFQAATILIIAQYWAGSRDASTRAVEVRFNDLILVARRMGLTHCRHAPEDVIHEALWVQKESQIRTINVILLLDCAFAFYQNYPCRFSISELVFDLPCNDSFYHAHHPFAQQNFCFSRAVTVFDAFQTLLASKSSVKGSTIISSDSNNGKGFKVSVLDMFILIHVLHSFLNSCIATFIPAMAKVNNSSSTPSPLTAIASALDLWHQLWIGLQAEIADHEWKTMGFYKNGYNFWLVAQLLVEKEKKSVDIITKMDSLCIDRLERLNLLLLEDNSN